MKADLAMMISSLSLFYDGHAGHLVGFAMRCVKHARFPYCVAQNGPCAENFNVKR